VSARTTALLSASGVPLEGDKLMRVTYTDESGLSSRELILVQAAIIVHGDDQVVPVEEYLESLVEKHIPADKRTDFFFHATDIYGGGSKGCIFRDENEWPDERRWAILDDLVAIPAKFGLPICVGLIEKAKFPSQPHERAHTPLEISVAMHAMAIIQCEIGVELWLRLNTKMEITHIIAEDNGDVRLAAREAHMLLRNKDAMEKEGFVNHPCFPFKRIRDGLQFTSKAESRLLQIADACAWAIRRIANGMPNAPRFYGPLRSQIVELDEKQIASLKEQPS
jgi:hypothetical protein